MARLGLTGAVLTVTAAAVLGFLSAQTGSNQDLDKDLKQGGIHKIRHVIVIMQENRSFDSYFGTYPGADGIPAPNGEFTVCVPDPRTGNCVKPFHDRNDRNGGGPHGAPSAVADVDGGKMDGFIAQAEQAQHGCTDPTNPACSNSATPDVMGYHDGNEIPNYWAYAANFVLQDRMFEPNASWSLPEHLFQVSEWSALCRQHDDPSSCTNALQAPGLPPDSGHAERDAAQPDLRLDGSHLPSAQKRCQLGILRRGGHRARLPGR